MLTEKQLHRYADILIWGLKISRKKNFKKNDIILIQYHRPAIRLAEILYAKILEMGFNPIQRIRPTPEMELSFYEISSRRQLVFQTPGVDELYRRVNGSIFLNSPESVTHLSHIEPKKISTAIVARKYLRDILDKRDDQGYFGWTLCIFPTPELARQADIEIDDYEKQIARACFLNRREPVTIWAEIHRNAGEIKKWLNSLDIRRLHIESESVDLEILPGNDRRWIGITGHNIPSFEIFLSPDWRGTKGYYYADQPSYRNGNYVKGVKLTFKEGKVVNADAETGEVFLKKQLMMDSGSNRVGEFSLTDRRFSKIDRFMANTLYDENFGGKFGNCHIALGSSYSNAYAGDPGKLTQTLKNELGFNDSALHWDLVNTEKKTVTAYLSEGKKKVIYTDGKFAY